MAPHSSTLAWKIPWMEEPGRLQSMGSLRAGHDRATEQLHFSLSCTGEGNGNPLQCSCLENPRDGEAWWAPVYGVAQSRTRLKRLSSSSSNPLFLKIKLWNESYGLNICWDIHCLSSSANIKISLYNHIYIYIYLIISGFVHFHHAFPLAQTL